MHRIALKSEFVKKKTPQVAVTPQIKRPLLFCNVKQRELVIGDRHFGTPNRYIMDCLTIECWTDSLSQNICKKHRMRNIQDEQKASTISWRKPEIFKNEFILLYDVQLIIYQQFLNPRNDS